MLAIAIGCGEEPPTDPVPVDEPDQEPTSIVVTPSSAILLPDETVQLIANVLDQNGDTISGAVVRWSSAAPGVVSVDDDGLVTAVAAGSTHVAARHENLEALVGIEVSNDAQRLALAALYKATNGPEWNDNTNWLSDRPMGEWHGLDVHHGKVYKVYLADNGLSGTIPPQIGDLLHLELLSLAGNALAGPVPPEIGEIRGLDNLELQGNVLGGLLPLSMTGMWLSSLNYQDTNLCAPRWASFGEWLEGLREYHIQPCVPTRHDKLVLTELYHSLGGPGWTRHDGWLSDQPLSEWSGVVVDADGRVAELDLADNGVTGGLSPSLRYLDALKVLDLRDNSGLAGTLSEWVTEVAVNAFHLDGTELCVPPSREFEHWLSGLQDWSGTRCMGADSVVATVPVHYLTQTVQNREGGVPLIAGRDALLRVFVVADSTNYFDSEVRAAFHMDGEEIHAVTMTIAGRRGIGVEVDESRMERSHNAVIPGDVLVPGLEIVLEIDPSGKVPLKVGSERRVPESGTLALDVRELAVMELTIVPVQFTGQADSSTAVAASNLTLASHELKEIRTMLPLDSVDFAVREKIEVSFSAWSSNSLGILRTLRSSDGATGYYLGISSRPGGEAILGGWVAASALNGITMAHEIGHNLGLRHAPCGPSLINIDEEYPYPRGRTGAWGYDAELDKLMDPGFPDVMSYCEPPWISDYHFSNAFEHRLEVEGVRSARSSIRPERVPTLFIWGRVDTAGVVLEPAIVMNGRPIPPRTGPYRLVGWSDGGERLFAHGISPMREAESNEGRFFVALPMEDSWSGELARITLAGPMGTDSLDRMTRRAPLAIVTDRETGRILSVLRNFAEVPEAGPGEEIIVSHGLPNAMALPARHESGSS